MKKNLLKLTTVLVLVLLTVSLLSGCNTSSPKTPDDSNGGSEVQDDTVYEFRFGHAADQNNTWHKAAMKFAEEVEEKSEGRINIRVYPNEQLGGEIDNITAIQAGTADMVLSGESLQNFADIVGIMSTPYLIQDSDHLQAVINGEPGQRIEQAIEEGAGLKVLTYFERGPRMLTSNKPINDINDLDGLRLRIPNVPLFVEVWNEWGARPTPMDFSELFTGLQQNTVEAQENPLALTRSGGFYEVQNYVNNTAHVRGWIYMLIGEDQWNELPEDLQQVMIDAAQVAQDYEHQLFLEDEEAVYNFVVEEQGLEFIETDVTEMIQVAEEYYENNFSEEYLEMYNMIRDLR
ncbi:tripartite ATP-independent transporter DctP family solute receptor [Natranaerovirga hydrolytica]|uniref:Tripartite ATP-independent transporter DctP family solute receptor n=1 Tax=Natranaerovirga hydrolytica TaxID=680378 RepID=A0A4R1MLK6_9FIRM|nr:TRAP transporter substrate-binding protein [Natranaerovirga hydrolytica]TCK92742.1 tripartite ATP-independent transporter DctP family solute receptor [Natranaerovirga hydrolytica]